MVFQQNLLEKALFIRQNVWFGHGPADQFWLLESALREDKRLQWSATNVISRECALKR